MKWSEEQEEICCQIYIDEIINNQSYFADVKNHCIILAKLAGLPQSEGSIKMKFQNIRAICDKKGIVHNSPFLPLKNYSIKNEVMFMRVYLKFLNQKNNNFFV